MKNLRKNKGITLIALIITIIILLILAGVTISLTLGDNGLFKTAQQAAKNYIDAENKEKEDLYNFDNTIKEIVGGTDDEETGGEGTGGGTNEETLFGQISSVNYGDYVSGYGIDLGIATAGNAFSNGKKPVTDWRIFYKDKTNVYLIASDYLPTSKYPAGIFASNNGKYNGYWALNSSNFTTLTTSGTVTTNNNFLFTKLSNVTNTNLNYQAVATLLDSSKWSTLANTSWVDDKDKAVIGTPTVEMWMASWNEKYTDTLAFDATTIGYNVGLTAEGLGRYSFYISSSDMQEKTGFTETLYYPHGNTITNNWNNCYGYWLASPSANVPDGLLFVHYSGQVNYGYFSTSDYGVRPVVCLSSGVKATSSTTDGVTTWTLSE